MIEKLAIARGHEITLKIDRGNQEELTSEHLNSADVAIEFSQPESAFSNISTCINSGIPVISGTTGWLERKDEIDRLCLEKEGAFLYASNFSIGVNISFAVNELLAKFMDEHSSYEPTLEEIHHTQKLDAPSGTGITLAEGILNHVGRKSSWVNQNSDKPEELSIISKRIDQVPGTHTVSYASEIDTIEIKHIAHSREGFASGALLAAEWIIGKKGSFSMKDVLGMA